MKTTLIDLGFVVGKLKEENGYITLTLLSESENTENVHIPSQSITVVGKYNLNELRDALNKFLPD